MKFIFLFLLGMLLVETLSSQCYLQYTYNASGHRIKREYAGGCDNPEVFINLPFIQQLIRVYHNGK